MDEKEKTLIVDDEDAPKNGLNVVQRQALHGAGPDITAETDLDTLLRSIVSCAIDVIGGASGGVYVHRPDEDGLERVVSIGADQPPVGTIVHRGEGLPGGVWETNEPVIVDNHAHREDQAGSEHASPTEATISVPVRWDDRFLGVLDVCAERPRTFSPADAELLSPFATSAAIAIQNARLNEELKHRLAQTRLIQEVMLGTASTLDFSLALERTVKALHRAMEIDHLGFLLPDDREVDCTDWNNTRTHDQCPRTHDQCPHNPSELVSHPSLVGLAKPAFRLPIQGSLAGQVYCTGQPVLMPDLAQVPTCAEQGLDVCSALIVPVRVGDRVAAVLYADSRQIGAFGEDELRLFTAISGQLGVALENTRLFTSLAHEKERLDLLFRLSHRLSKSLDVHEVAQRALDDLCAVVEAKQGIALVREPGDERLHMAVISGHRTESVETLDQRLGLRIGDGIVGWVAAQRQSALVNDVTQDERWQPVPGLDEWVRSAIGVPLLSGDELVGALGIYSDRVNSFNEEHRLLVESAAATVAAAVANAQLYEAERNQRQEAETLRDAAMALTAALDRNEVIERILARLQEVVPYDTASVQLLRGDRMEIVGGRGFPNLPALMGATFPADGDNPNSEVIRTRAPFVVANAPAVYAAFRRETHAPARIRSWLGVPMLVGKRLVGMIALDKHDAGFYTHKHTRLAEAFAAQAAIAIEKSHLFQAEREQRELAEALEEAAAAVSSTLHLDQVLDRILEQVARIVAGDAFNVMLIDDDTARMVRWRGYEHLNSDDKIALFTVSITKYPSLQRMMQTGEPAVIPDTAADPDWIPLQDSEWRRSYVAAPIQVKDRTVGFLNVNGTRPGQFGPADAQRLAAFAHHAATAVENAQLYRELRTRAEQLEQRVQERTAQLEDQYAQLGAILDSATDGIIVADADGKILQTNRIAEAWLTQTLSPEDATTLRRTVRYLAKQAKQRPEAVVEMTGLDLEMKAAPISRSGMEETLAVVAVHDVSHLKALERVKSRFVSSVSHELRTPITTIKLYASLLQNTSPEAAEWRKYLDALAQEADRQAQLVQDIIQISRIDTGRLEMRPRLASLNELTDETVINHQRLANKRGVELEHHLAEPGPETLVDAGRMMQVLNNLVENATRYTPPGGKVVVSTGTHEAEERLWATVTVADTGIGIPQEELPHIFERFFRGKVPRQMQSPGTGLGLAIVKAIVELHGGRVMVESQVDVGTTFTIWLPLAKRRRLEEEA
jgi:GAF domain-containing protein